MRNSSLYKVDSTIEGLKAELVSCKQQRLALQRLCPQSQDQSLTAKVKEDMLKKKIVELEVNLATSAKAEQHALAERNDAVDAQESAKQKLEKCKKEAIDLAQESAQSRKALANKNMEIIAVEAKAKELQKASNIQLAEVKVLQQKLENSEVNRRGLVRQVDELTVLLEQLRKEKKRSVQSARKTKDEAAIFRDTVNTMVTRLEGEIKTSCQQVKQLKHQVKAVCGDKVASDRQREEKMARMSGQIERLLLENVELKKELQMFEEDGGVIALD